MRRVVRRQRGFSPALGRSPQAFSRPGGSAAQAAGFTLIEVVVAFGLLALALTLLLGALSGAARQIHQAALSGRAALHAQTLLAQVGAGGGLEPGHDEGDLDQGRYHWTLDIAPWTDPRLPTDGLASPGAARLLEVQLSVRWGARDGERLQWRSLRLAPAEGTLGATQ
ncbi:general secretion pathway protein I [Pseudoxanthomonas sp. GM95]|uniref:type II secretion system protein XpsI n=1 Tax=Pseudoxanthomonas sp. GM95 TaxID=1881043 RepID=UPI0008C0ECF5|nr:general secretion pathway protein GspI [Pseudoxanthomonas sp. GM95]SEK45359.1 general secretion pathway protein I [Pseudoxanthomonas sp. GM95]